MRKTILFFSVIFLFSTQASATINSSIEMSDKIRERTVPIETYEDKKITSLPVVIINHGYGAKNTEYSFIANSLAEEGYFVVSIQHDLADDAPLARTGDIFKRRKPIWERGVQNILFTITELKKNHLNLNLDKVILIGHSNGGDISMMFAERYPEKVSKVISLDSLRYPFPTNNKLQVLHFSANDTKADPSVIPAEGIKTILIAGAKHMDFYDRGDADIKAEVLKNIVQFLNR
jgi:pimeloyl-ACP methyl ester carboxylesterase